MRLKTRDPAEFQRQAPLREQTGRVICESSESLDEGGDATPESAWNSNTPPPATSHKICGNDIVSVGTFRTD
jgi:hypothetical protein